MIADRYPAPKYHRIIEPFAGSARYALEYFDREVLLVDKYEVITGIWKYLQQCSPKDILSLPRFNVGDNINDYSYDCEEQRNLVGFLVGFGFASPRQIATVRLRHRPNAMNYTINKIAKNLFKIRHWEIQTGSYEDIPNQTASWFIDPPYQIGGHKYPKSSKKIDFNHLAEYCRSRSGQVIVCESTKANWLPFKPMIQQNVLSGRYSEAIWSNIPTSFDSKQLKLDL